MEPFQLLEKEALFLAEWEKEIPELIAGFSTKKGGESLAPYSSLNLGLHVKDKTETVLRNREKLAGIIGFSVDDWISGQQVHQHNVKTVTLEDRGKGSRSTENALKGIDGLLTNEPGVLATAFFADCVPLFFIDSVTGWLGIAHAGWKGTVAGIGREMVNSFCDHGSDPSNIRAAIGPSISKEHYEVDVQVMNSVPDKWKTTVSTPGSGGKYLLDLKKLNKLILEEAGIQEKHIAISSYCTYQDEELFFSHRRDQGSTGRMLGFIGKAIND